MRGCGSSCIWRHRAHDVPDSGTLDIVTTTERDSIITPVQPRARHTYDALVNATRELVREHRGAWPATSDVAERAGVSIGSLYRYFTDIRHLMATVHSEDQVFQAHRELLRAAGAAARRRPRPGARQQAEAALEALIIVLSEDPDPELAAAICE
ncbi:hypothetical protein C5C18_05990 [Rathayibacter tritici]|nr:hypothetical protein C5C21_11665 [Rathayibacter tritici]PPG08067.1 hypothetical protein C5C18_05990 [Rathayibacter tritici]